MQWYPATRILALTTFDDEPTVRGMLAAGASCFLLKDIQPAQLIEVIGVLHRGDALLSPSVTRLLLGDLSRAGSDTERLSQLAITAYEAAGLICLGDANSAGC